MEKMSIIAGMLAVLSLSTHLANVPEKKIIAHSAEVLTSTKPELRPAELSDLKTGPNDKTGRRAAASTLVTVKKPATSEELASLKEIVVAKKLPAAESIATDSLSKTNVLIASLKKALEQNNLPVSDSLSRAVNTALWQEKRSIREKEIETRMRASVLVRNENQTALPDIRQDLLKFEKETISKKSLALQAAEKAYDEASLELRKQRREARLTQNETTAADITHDLLEAGVITSGEGLSYRLHNMFLIVNGQQQPEALHKRLRDKYLKYAWTEWVLNWDGESGVRFTGVRYGS